MTEEKRNWKSPIAHAIEDVLNEGDFTEKEKAYIEYAQLSIELEYCKRQREILIQERNRLTQESSSVQKELENLINYQFDESDETQEYEEGGSNETDRV